MRSEHGTNPSGRPARFCRRQTAFVFFASSLVAYAAQAHDAGNTVDEPTGEPAPGTLPPMDTQQAATAPKAAAPAVPNGPGGDAATNEQLPAAIESVNALGELSLEDLLNLRLVTSTKSKAMNLRDSPNVMTLITRDEIQRSGARELGDILRLVPGIQLGGDLYSNVFVGFRGIWGSEGKLLLLLDGHPMYELFYYGSELSNRIPVDQIDSIEIIRGPGSVVYGDAAELLVINILTRSARDLEGVSVTAIYGQMLDGAVHHGQSLTNSFGQRTISAAFGKTIGGRQGLALKAGVYYGQSNRSDQDFTDVNGDTYNLTGSSRADPLLFSAAADYRGLKLGWLFEYYRTNMRDGYGTMLARTLPVNYLTSSLQLSYEWNITQNLRLVPRFHWLYQMPWRTVGDVVERYEPSFYWKETAQRLLGGVALMWDVLPQLNILLGSEYYVDSATNDLYPFVDPDNPSQEVPHVSYWDATVYGQALLNTSWVNLSGGMRFEHREHVGGSFVPRMGVTKTLGPFHLKLLFSRAFRTPAIGDLANAVDVKPETTDVGEAEIGYQIHPTVFVVLNGYDITIHRPFAYYYDSATDKGIYRNFDEMGTRGLELELRFKSERAFANLSYSYYTAAGKSRIDTVSVPGRSDVLLGFSPHKVGMLAGAGLSQHVDASLSAIVLAGHRFGYYTYDASGAPVGRDYGAEFQMSAYVRYRDLLVHGSFVGLGVANLTNTRTVLIQPYDNGRPPMPGMSREVFVRMGFDASEPGKPR